MIQAAATRHGPRTCGCVAYYFYCLSWLATVSRVRVQGEHEAWPLCPICKGSGVDPRIPLSTLDHYLGLERVTRDLDTSDPEAAEIARIDMDRLWYQLSAEERAALNAR